jgi:hypothetical protein
MGDIAQAMSRQLGACSLSSRLIVWQVIEGRRLASRVATGGAERASSELTP